MRARSSTIRSRSACGRPARPWRADFRRRGIVISADRVALTASTSEAYALLFKLLCDAGDAVLVPHPSYPLFEHLTRLEVGRRRAVRARISRLVAHRHRLGAPRDGRSSARDPGRVAEQSDGIVPASRRPRRSWRDRRGRRCAAHRRRSVCRLPHRSGAAAATHVLAGGDVLAFSLGGLSKSAGLPQLKLGWIGFGGPPDRVDDVLARVRNHRRHLSVGLDADPGGGGRADRERHGAFARRFWRASNATSNRSARRPAAFPAVTVLPVEGGWSAVMQVPSVGSEEALVLALLEKDDVLVHPGYFFDFPREAFIVVSLLVEPSTVRPRRRARC